MLNNLIKIKENEMTTTTKVKIKVTAEDIVEGVQQDCIACPVARAVRRVVKDKVRIEVRDLSVLIEIPEHLIHIENSYHGQWNGSMHRSEICYVGIVTVSQRRLFYLSSG